MGVSKAVVNTGLKHMLDVKTMHSGYIVDDRGNEVQITASMVRSACYQLLKQCRNIKN
ncbi:PA1571 family protein [Acinetobacter tianfuensis]|uniref:PA1571 family protein n=1 Tax=Acinetobacter tianfuensis TaxID=2419603 RepID=UPI00148C7A43|nr:PA1571 family protein [Acinetobacter tianfuensis]